MAAAEETPSSPKYDLTPRMAPFLDRHLVFPLLEFLSKKDIYPQREVTRSKIELMSKTHMIDYIIDTHNKLGEGPAPAGLNERRTEVVNKLKQLKTECAPLTKLLDDQNLIKQLKANKQFNMPYLIENHEVTPASLDALFNFAKFQFECGQYSNTADQLYHYRTLSSDQDKCFSALWGKFGAEILILDWDTALDTLNRLREEIDNRNPAFTPVQQLQQRTWLIHWSLFVFFNHPNGRNGIIDLFFQDKYINAIQTACPHILRYLTTAVITNKRRRNVLKDLVNVIQQERYTYRDPITEFLECLYVNFDFERAQQKLRECAEVLNNDFFLVACRDDFMNNARLFIFETYCRIHSTIDIDMLAEKLSMKRDEAEKWIVNLIRGARMDNAKIDSKANRVIMGTQYPTVYQQVIEKTKGLSFHSLVLANSIERREAEMQNAREGN